MLKEFPPDLHDLVIDLEIDLGPPGGLQRFRKVSDIEQWIASEGSFWQFLLENPARGHLDPLGLESTFFKLINDLSGRINAMKGHWESWYASYLSNLTAYQEAANETKDVTLQNLTAYENKLEARTEELKNNLTAIIREEIVDKKRYLPSMNPDSHFVKRVAEVKPCEAVYTLDQILLYRQGKGDRRAAEPYGRSLGAMHLEGREVDSTDYTDAFSQATAHWSDELRHFKQKYDDLVAQFSSLATDHTDLAANWDKDFRQKGIDYETSRTAFEVSGNEAIARMEENLRNLTDTYERHMQLKGPMVYWKGKKKQHRDRARKLVIGTIITGLAALGIMLFSAQWLLPASHGVDTVPWRPIGLFLIVSSLSLWMVRLMVKLLLSNIHLASDAEERVVMINTFMALMRRPQSAEGLAKEDIAIILAPIFKPSTSGIIKDDGGPTSLGDFITRMSGGKE